MDVHCPGCKGKVSCNSMHLYFHCKQVTLLFKIRRNEQFVCVVVGWGSTLTMTFWDIMNVKTALPLLETLYDEAYSYFAFQVHCLLPPYEDDR